MTDVVESVTDGLVEQRSEVIGRLQSAYVPPYSQLVRAVSRERWIPRALGCVLIGSVPFAVGLLIAGLVGEPRAFVSQWLRSNITPILITTYLFMDWIYGTTVAEGAGLLDMLSSVEQVTTVDRCLHAAFRSPGQWVLCSVAGVAIPAMSFALGLPLQSRVLTGYLLFMAAAAGFGLAFGGWYTFSSMYLMRVLRSFADLHLNPVSPARSVTLRQLASVLGTWTLYYSVEGTLVLIGLRLPNWTADPSVVTTITAAGIIVVALVAAVSVLTYQLSLRAIVLNHKAAAMRVLQHTTCESFPTLEVDPSCLENLIKLSELSQKIDASPNSLVNWSALVKGVSATSLPLIGVALNGPTAGAHLLKFSVQFMRTAFRLP